MKRPLPPDHPSPKVNPPPHLYQGSRGTRQSLRAGLGIPSSTPPAVTPMVVISFGGIDAGESESGGTEAAGRGGWFLKFLQKEEF
jgi:hypothetical protein